MQPGSPQFWLWEEQTENLTIPANRWRLHPEISKCVSLHAKFDPAKWLSIPPQSSEYQQICTLHAI